jgi:hypothetical protein
VFPRSRLARLVPPDRLDHLEASHAQLPDGQQRAQERAWAAVDNDTLRHQLNLEPAEDDYETVVDHVDAAGAHA